MSLTCRQTAAALAALPLALAATPASAHGAARRPRALLDARVLAPHEPRRLGGHVPETWISWPQA